MKLLLFILLLIVSRETYAQNGLTFEDGYGVNVVQNGSKVSFRISTKYLGIDSLRNGMLSKADKLSVAANTEKLQKQIDALKQSLETTIAQNYRLQTRMDSMKTGSSGVSVADFNTYKANQQTANDYALKQIAGVTQLLGTKADTSGSVFLSKAHLKYVPELGAYDIVFPSTEAVKAGIPSLSESQVLSAKDDSLGKLVWQTNGQYGLYVFDDKAGRYKAIILSGAIVINQ